MSDPLSSWRLWPTNQSVTPRRADRGQQSKRSPFRTPGLARLVSTAVVIRLRVTQIQHHERPHQHCLQQLQWQITQLTQKTTQRPFHFSVDKYADLISLNLYINVLIIPSIASILNTLYTVFRKKHLLLFSYITLRKCDQF